MIQKGKIIMENTVVKNYTMSTLEEFFGDYTVCSVEEYLGTLDNETKKRSALISKSIDKYLGKSENKYNILKNGRLNA